MTSLFGVSRGEDENPTMVNTLPAMNVGTTSAGISTSASGSTGSLSYPGVSTLPSSCTTTSASSTSIPELSKIQVIVSVDNLITRSLYKQGMQVVADALKKESEKQEKQIRDFQQFVVVNFHHHHLLFVIRRSMN